MQVRVGRRRTDDGAAAVEFALILIPMLVVVFGLIQYGLYFYSAQTGSNTANAATRQLSVGNCETQSAIETFVNTRLGAAKTGNATVSMVWKDPGGTTVNRADSMQGTVTLTISFPTLNMHFPFVPFLSDPKVHREVTARVEDLDSAGCPS